MCCIVFDTVRLGSPIKNSPDYRHRKLAPDGAACLGSSFGRCQSNRRHRKSNRVPGRFLHSPSAESVHGISTRHAMEEGTPLGNVLEAFLGAMSAADTLVAHSVNFDRSVVGAEVVRQRGDDALEQTWVPWRSAS